jgi:hypothetical protein
MVVVHAEVSMQGQQSSNDGFRLGACVAGTCTAASATGGSSGTDTTVSYDVTALRPGGGSWTLTDIAGLQVQVRPMQQGGGQTAPTWRVDRVWAEVTTQVYTYSTSVRLDWTGVPTGVIQSLELRYRATGDTFEVQVWDGAAFATRGTPLNAATATTWTYTLTSAEYNGGAPRIRIIDATPTANTQGTLFLDYARVGTS